MGCVPVKPACWAMSAEGSMKSAVCLGRIDVRLFIVDVRRAASGRDCAAMTADSVDHEPAGADVTLLEFKGLPRRLLGLRCSGAFMVDATAGIHTSPNQDKRLTHLSIRHPKSLAADTFTVIADMTLEF